MCPYILGKNQLFRLDFASMLDLGKVLHHHAFGGIPQWAVVGEHSLIDVLFGACTDSVVFFYGTNLYYHFQVTHFLLDAPLMSQLFITRSFSDLPLIFLTST